MGFSLPDPLTTHDAYLNPESTGDPASNPIGHWKQGVRAGAGNYVDDDGDTYEVQPITVRVMVRVSDRVRLGLSLRLRLRVRVGVRVRVRYGVRVRVRGRVTMGTPTRYSPNPNRKCAC